MKCIYCGSKTGVGNSRLQRRKNTVWRRRYCRECQATFTTIESPDLSSSLVIEHQGIMVPFLRDELYTSLFLACGHRRQATEEAAALADTITAKLLQKPTNGQITRTQLVETTLQVLKAFDKAAATQYAAYHPV
jgi:transcriptional regulator NrdR family protein